MINGMHACNGACQPMHCAVKTNDMAWVSMSISWSFKSSEQKLDILAALSTQCCQKAWQSHFLDPSWQKGGYSAARYKFDIREWFLNFFGQTQQHHRRKSKACCCNFKLLQYFRCDHSIREANGTWNISDIRESCPKSWRTSSNVSGLSKVQFGQWVPANIGSPAPARGGA